jgi:hypothetical protein
MGSGRNRRDGQDISQLRLSDGNFPLPWSRCKEVESYQIPPVFLLGTSVWEPLISLQRTTKTGCWSNLVEKKGVGLPRTLSQTISVDWIPLTFHIPDRLMSTRTALAAEELCCSQQKSLIPRISCKTQMDWYYRLISFVVTLSMEALRTNWIACEIRLLSTWSRSVRFNRRRSMKWNRSREVC